MVGEAPLARAGRSLVRELMSTLRELETSATAHSFCDEVDLREGKLRQLLFGLSGSVTHRVVYHVEEQTVSVVRVLHTARDTPPIGE